MSTAERSWRRDRAEVLTEDSSGYGRLPTTAGVMSKPARASRLAERTNTAALQTCHSASQYTRVKKSTPGRWSCGQVIHSPWRTNGISRPAPEPLPPQESLPGAALDDASAAPLQDEGLDVCILAAPAMRVGAEMDPPTFDIGPDLGSLRNRLADEREGIQRYFCRDLSCSMGCCNSVERVHGDSRGKGSV